MDGMWITIWKKNRRVFNEREDNRTTENRLANATSAIRISISCQDKDSRMVFFCVLSFVVLCSIHQYIGFGVIPCIISWNYFFLFDKKRRVYKDSYSPQTWECFGTIVASLLFRGIVILFLIECPNIIFRFWIGWGVIVLWR